MAISAENLYWKSGNKHIINGVSLSVKLNEFVGIVGPNGSGKSSLVSLLSGIKKPTSGHITLFGQPLNNLQPRLIAQQLAFVKQHIDTDDHITARQSVELGRTPYLSLLSPWSKHDDEIVEEALSIVDMMEKSKQLWPTLSGGERQRLHIARGLVQKPKMIILDEPTNNLDVHHQLNLLNLVKQLKLTTIAVLHDLNHAAMYCDRLIVIQGGKIAAVGTPKEVLTKGFIREIFKVDVECYEDSEGQLFIRFIQSC